MSTLSYTQQKNISLLFTPGLFIQNSHSNLHNYLHKASHHNVIEITPQYGTDAAGRQCQTRHQVSRQNQIPRGIDAVKKSDAQLDLLVKEIFRS